MTGSRGFLWLSVLLIVLGVLIVSGGAYWYVHSQKQASKMPIYQPATTTQQLQTNTADPTADWKTYKDAAYGFSFKYPPTWTLHSPNDDESIYFSKSPAAPTVAEFLSFYVAPLDLGKEYSASDYVTPQEYFDYYYQPSEEKIEVLQIGKIPVLHIVSSDDRYTMYTADREITFVLYPGDRQNPTDYQSSDDATVKQIIQTFSFTDPSKSFVYINIFDSATTTVAATLCGELYKESPTTLLFIKRDSNYQALSSTKIDISRVATVTKYEEVGGITSTILSIADWLAEPYLLPVGAPPQQECTPGAFDITGNYNSGGVFIASSINETGQ